MKDGFWPKVLLVESDESQAQAVSSRLATCRYEVRTAADSAAAVREIERDCPHYLLVQWPLPGTDSGTLCSKIREMELPNYVFVILLAEQGGPQAAAEGLNLGADEVLPRPAPAEELLARMNAGARMLSLERRLQRMISVDPVTGLATRRAFLAEARREHGRAVRYGRTMACVMIDIDFFKRVNDSFGHQAGDDVLKAVAEVLAGSSRASDLVCRYGGEEFCALLPETDEDGAAEWADRVRDTISRLRLPLGGWPIAVTASAGVAEWLSETSRLEDMIELADQALLVAKESGRDRVVRHSILRDSALLARCNERNPFHGATARDVMTPLVPCLKEDETVGEATDFFLRFRIAASPVVDGRGKLVGILSEKDLIPLMTMERGWERPIRDVMRGNIVCYGEETPAQKICDFFVRSAVRRVIIVDDGYPVGIVSRGTMLRWYRNWLVARGIVAAAPAPGGDGSAESHKSLLATSQLILQEAEKLCSELRETLGTPLGPLIRRASNLEELNNDLLVQAQSITSGARREGSECGIRNAE
ncbi:MAG: diguanylate cyclase [Planctomycetia bacterium]|nr:diguanylate cyclase [Planctomycetia bacterium]